MITSFMLVLMTKNLEEQIAFYHGTIGLDLIFHHSESAGLGKHDQLYVILKKDTSADSHHLSEQKGPQIITFQCQGDLNQFSEKIRNAGYKIRNKLFLEEQDLQYLFAEDFDRNEVCFGFSLKESELN